MRSLLWLVYGALSISGYLLSSMSVIWMNNVKSCVRMHCTCFRWTRLILPQTVDIDRYWNWQLSLVSTVLLCRWVLLCPNELIDVRMWDGLWYHHVVATLQMFLRAHWQLLICISKSLLSQADIDTWSILIFWYLYRYFDIDYRNSTSCGGPKLNC